MECCVANQLLILTSINKTFAPCTMDYIYKYCPTTVSTTNFCKNGTFEDLGTIQAFIKLNFSATKGLPQMSNYDGYIKFRAVVTKLLNLSPLQVVVLSYTYYKGSVAQGQTIAGATSGEFRYQIMLSGLSSSLWSTSIQTMKTQKYPASIAAAYGQAPTVVTQFTIESTNYYVANPIQIPNSSVMNQSWSLASTSMLCLLLGIILIYMK